MPDYLQTIYDPSALMLMVHFDRMAIAVHDAVPPTDDEWDHWLAFYEARPPEVRALIESQYGVGPNAKQRKVMAEKTKGIDVRAAILTDSFVVRGIVTAIAWMGIPQRAFGLGHYVQAGDFLGLTRDELTRSVEELAQLKAEMLNRLSAIQM